MTAGTIHNDLDTHLGHEWETAYATTALPDDWSLIDPGIEGLATLADLLVQLRPAGRYANCDVVFLALITRAQAGEDLAARVLLQQLQPRCRQLLATAAKRHRRQTPPRRPDRRRLRRRLAGHRDLPTGSGH